MPSAAHERARALYDEAAQSLEGMPTAAARKVALDAVQHLRDELIIWIERAQQLQVTCEQMGMGVGAGLQRPAAADAQAAVDAADSAGALGPSICKMLIVEDSSFQAMTMLALAEDCGYSAHVVASAQEALEVLHHDEDINLVLTDVMMDGTDGYQLLRQIRSDFEAHIAVVMVSANESTSLVEQCVAQGADAYMLKPMRVLELKNLWQFVWRRRHLSVLNNTVPSELLSTGQKQNRNSEPQSGPSHRPILRPDEAQRAAAAGLDDLAVLSQAYAGDMHGEGLEKAIEDVERLVAAPPAASKAAAASAADEAARDALSAAADSTTERTVCKLCEQQVPKHMLREHVVSCSALASCHERMREMDTTIKKTAALLAGRHTKLETAVDDLQGQIDALKALKALLLEVAATRIVGGKASPAAAAKHIEQLIDAHEIVMREASSGAPKRKAAIMMLWEKVRRLPRSKVSLCWDVLSLNDPAGSGASTRLDDGSGAQARKVAMKDFDIVDVLGSGGYGMVYLARRRSTMDLVAIKALTKAHLRETNALANVQLERLILSSAQSPYVVELFFSFSSRANVYMVMEYMPRGDCHDLLHQLGFFEEDLACFYLAETVEGLAYLHSQGVIMRDLKPQNMMIGADGHLKLTDFGLSAAYHGTASIDTPPASIPGLPGPAPKPGGHRGGDGTKNVGVDGGARMVSGWFGGGQCVGTPNYLAPEVLLYKRVRAAPAVTRAVRAYRAPRAKSCLRVSRSHPGHSRALPGHLCARPLVTGRGRLRVLRGRAALRRGDARRHLREHRRTPHQHADHQRERKERTAARSHARGLFV